MGDDLDWSPKASPKQKKKKGFVRLSSYEGATFSSVSGNQGGGGTAAASPMSISKSMRNVLDPSQMHSERKPGKGQHITPAKITKCASTRSFQSARIDRSHGGGSASCSNQLSNLKMRKQ